MSERFPNDVDPIETRDWLQAIESVIREEGVERAQYLIDQLLKRHIKCAATKRRTCLIVLSRARTQWDRFQITQRIR